MESHPPENKDRRNWRFAFLLLILLVLALLVMEFNNRLNDLYRLENEKEIVKARYEAQEATQVALHSAIEDAKSDRYIEGYARQKGKMKQDGDHSLVIVPGAGITPSPVPSPTPFIEEETNPQRWLDLFLKPLR